MIRYKMARRQRCVLAAVAATTALEVWGSATPASAVGQDSWYLDEFRVEQMWQHAKGEGVTVAVIDSGVEASLPELKGKVLDGLDLSYEPDKATIDDHGHGTDMAALIAGTGAGGGLQGLAPEVSILPIRISDYGLSFELERQIAEGVQYAIESGAKIINISQASEFEFVGGEAYEAFADAARNDVLIFAGAGNDAKSGNPLMFPADQEGVIGVGAVDRDKDRASYSNYGPQVALSAPGEDIPGHCSWPHRATCIVKEGGTSSATALASAAAALIWSEHPDWSKNQVLRVMMETADGPAGAERNDEIGYGMVRPDRVIIDGEGDPGDPDINPLFPEYEANLPPTEPDPAEIPDSSNTSPESVPDAEQERYTSPDDVPTAEADSGSDIGPWLLFALAGAILASGLITALVLRRNDRHHS